MTRWAIVHDASRGGIGFFASQPPFAYWKKSAPGFVAGSRFCTSMSWDSEAQAPRAKVRSASAGAAWIRFILDAAPDSGEVGQARERSSAPHRKLARSAGKPG